MTSTIYHYLSLTRDAIKYTGIVPRLLLLDSPDLLPNATRRLCSTSPKLTVFGISIDVNNTKPCLGACQETGMSLAEHNCGLNVCVRCTVRTK